MSATYFWALFLLIGGTAFILAGALQKINAQQRAIARALFARIPLRDPTEQEIEKAAKEEIDWIIYDYGRLNTPQASMNNTIVRQRVRDRLYAKQFAPKLD